MKLVFCISVGLTRVLSGSICRVMEHVASVHFTRGLALMVGTVIMIFVMAVKYYSLTVNARNVPITKELRKMVNLVVLTVVSPCMH